MALTRTIRRIGGSLVVTIPPEIAQEAGLEEGTAVTLRSRSGRIEVERSDRAEQLKAEAARLAANPEYLAEVRAIQKEMEDIRAW